MFKPGDLTFHPFSGVSKVKSIEEKEVGGKKIRCYVLIPMHKDSKILVPINSANKINLRPLVSKTELGSIYASLKAKNPMLLKMNWNRRNRYFQEKMRTGTAIDIATLVGELSFLKRNRGLSYGEERIYNEVKKMLIKELSIVEDSSEEEIENKLNSILS